LSSLISEKCGFTGVFLETAPGGMFSNPIPAKSFTMPLVSEAVNWPGT